MTDAEKLPLVSVILCVYNGEHQVEKAIDDVLAQTYPHFELIVSDDASTDNTRKVLERYFGHPRVRIFLQPKNLGVVANKNFAIAQANGEFITQQDHDDRTACSRLERQIAKIQETETLISACGVRRLDKDGFEILRYASDRDMIMHEMPEGDLPFFFPPVMFHRSLWELHGPFHKYFSGTYGEDKYFVSCVLRTHSISVISDCLYDYCDRAWSATSSIRDSRSLVMGTILAHLAKQNRELGYNDLEIGNTGGLARRETELYRNRRFIAKQYRTYAARSVDHDQLKEAAVLLLKSAKSFPLSIDLVRTIVYFIRRTVIRSK